MLDLFRKVETPLDHEKAIAVTEPHFVNGLSVMPPFPNTMEIAQFGMGCFWGAERKFWQMEGIHVTAVGYGGGTTRNPTYKDVCTGMTGHAEIVLVVFDPAVIEYDDLLKVFWQSHDPTQGMRQGNDIGSQYRSVIFTSGNRQQEKAQASRDKYNEVLDKGGYAAITTEILPAGPFYYAEPYHQQYLAKNPDGYCGLGGTGIDFPRDSQC